MEERKRKETTRAKAAKEAKKAAKKEQKAAEQSTGEAAEARWQGDPRAPDEEYYRYRADHQADVEHPRQGGFARHP